MTPAQLRTFVAVVDAGTVRGAAEQLVVTQSAVSAALAALQRSLSIRLVERDGRGLRLTAAGEVYARYARLVLGLLDEAAAAAAGGEDPTRGRVRIAAVTTAGEHVLPSYLASFRSRFPDASLTLEVGNRERVWAMLNARETDVVIAGRPPPGSGLVTRAVRTNELVVVGATDASPDVERATWLLREEGSGTRQTTEAFFESLELDPPRLTLGSNGAVVAGAAAGLGLTLVSRDAVQRELDAGDLRILPVEGAPLVRPYHAVTRPEPTATTELFLEHLVRAGEEFGPQWVPGDEPP